MFMDMEQLTDIANWKQVNYATLSKKGEVWAQG
jgi:hypothetical protein